MNILIFLFILLSNGIFLRNVVPAYIRVFLAILLILVYGIIKQQCKINYNAIKIFFFLIFLQWISVLCNGLSYEFDFFLILVDICAVLFISNIPYSELIVSYRKVMLFICIVSDILFLIGLTPILRRLNFLIAMVPNTDLYAFLGTFIVRFWYPGIYYRNFGVFLEPGQFQLFLGLGLYFELFCTDKLRKRNLIIYLITFLTCNSTNGYITALFIIMAYIFESKKTKWNIVNTKRFFLISLPIIVFVLIVIKYRDSNFIATSIDKVMQLFESEYAFYQSGSGLERRRAFDVALSAFWENPFFGLGYNGLEQYVKNLNSTGFIMTFSPGNWFARFGFIYGIIANLGYIYFFCSVLQNKISKMVLALAILLMVSSQAVNGDLIMNILIGYGLNKFLIDNKGCRYDDVSRDLKEAK